MDLGDSMLGAISQSQRTGPVRFHFHEEPRSEWNAGVQGPGEGMGSECVSKGDMVSVWED